MKRKKCKESVDNLKVYLQSCGWETHHVEVVADSIVSTFEDSLLSGIYDSYDEIARNCGIGKPQPFDSKAIALIDQIKKCIG